METGTWRQLGLFNLLGMGMGMVALFVSLLILPFQCTKDGFLSAGLHAVQAFGSQEHGRWALALTLCRMRCAKADIDTVFTSHDCLHACSKFSKRGHRHRRSHDSTSTAASTKVTSSTTVETTLPGILIDGTNVRIVGPDVDLSKYDLKTADPSKPPPTLPKKILDVINPNPGFSKSCRAAISQLTDITSTGPDNDTGPVLSVDTAFKGGKDMQWQATVSWRHNSVQTMENITGYMVLWNSDTYSEDVNCRKLAQNQTTTTITSEDDGWRYPDVLYLTVQPIPAVKKVDLQLTPFSPKDPVPTYDAAGWPTQDPPKLIGAVISGVVCGVVLILFVAVILYKRRKPSADPLTGQKSDTSGNNNECATVTSKSSNHSTGGDRFLISYFPECETMVSSVERLCAWLRSQGYDAVMDNMASVEIAELGRDRWITQQIRKAKKIIIVKSTSYLKLCAEDLEGTAGPVSKQRVDVRFVSAEYYRTLSGSKFICIELEGFTCKNKAQEADCPPWMEHSYKWPRDRDKIVLRMNDQNPLQIA